MEIDYPCCSIRKDRKSFENVLQDIDLSNIQKHIIQLRFIHILENFQKRTRKHSFVYFVGHFIITVGSLFVPALLSIQNANSTITSGGTSFSANVYWSTFTLSLLVTICNAMLTLFRIDKKYYFLNTTIERLRSEGWQYMGLTGRYSGHLIGNAIPTHINQFVFFTHYIEKIKMKQVEEEYYKSDESHTHGPSNGTAASRGTSTNELYPPSPDQPIHLLAQYVPDPVQDAINSLIISRKSVDSVANIVVEGHHQNEDQNEDQNQNQDHPIHYKDAMHPPLI